MSVLCIAVYALLKGPFALLTFRDISTIAIPSTMMYLLRGTCATAVSAALYDVSASLLNVSTFYENTMKDVYMKDVYKDVSAFYEDDPPDMCEIPSSPGSVSDSSDAALQDD